MGGSSIYTQDDFDLWTKYAEDAITLRLDKVKQTIDGRFRISETESILAAVDIQVDLDWVKKQNGNCDQHIDKHSRALFQALEKLIEENGEQIYKNYLKALEEVNW